MKTKYAFSYSFRFSELLFAPNDVFGRNSSLRQIYVTFVFVHTNHYNTFATPDPNQFVDGPNATTRQLG